MVCCTRMSPGMGEGGASGRIAAQLSIPGGERRDIIDHAQPQRLPQALVVSKDKGFVLLDRSPRGYTELVSAERGDGGRVKVVARIERAVAQKFVGAAMKAICAGASDGADHATRHSPILGALIRGQNGELGYRVYPQVAAEDAARSLVRVVVDADSIQQII